MSSLWTVQYYQKVLALDPIAYWMLDEKSGAVAYDMVSGRAAGAQNGAHTAVTLAQSGVGDGRTSGSYDGATSYTNVYSATLAGAFNGAAGTVMIWAKVSAAGVWSDGTQRHAFTVRADLGNRVQIVRTTNNGELRFAYSAGGTAETVDLAGLSTTGWMNLAVTWSKADEEMRAYYNGVQTGATQINLGVWAGALAANTTVIGAATTTPGSEWSGTLAHCAIWDRAITPAAIADLAVVE